LSGSDCGPEVGRQQEQQAGGGWAARSTGRAGSGALAGFWFGVVLALLSGFALSARDVLFAGGLSTGAWLLDHFGGPTCNHTTGDHLAAVSPCPAGPVRGRAHRVRRRNRVPALVTA
jgi:hypothetical protein